MKDRRDDAPRATDPPNAGADPERLAALLDGRLDEAERDELLARLADHDDDLALFAEAAAIQRALEEEDAAAGMTDADRARFAEAGALPRALENGDAAAPAPYAAPVVMEAAYEPDVIPLRRPPPRVDRRLVLVAAVVAGLTLLPLAWYAGRPTAVSAPAHAVAMLESPDAGVPADWSHPWFVTRGEGAPAVERSVAAQVGALAVDLELAIRAGDAEQRTILARRIQLLLENTSAIAGTGFRGLAESTSTDRGQLLSELESAMETATGSVDADYAALGGWAEAARFAAARQDAEFFRATRTARTLDRAQALLAGNEEGRAALAQVAAARATDPPDWRALTPALDALLAAIAS